MMHLITGLPGNGKTLYTLWMVDQLAKKDGRPVYYHGIPELTLNWFQLDKAEEWYKLPEGSIVVIDECQKVFPPRSSGSKAPETEAQMETHRHRGFDLFLLTQHPSLVSNHVRKLCGKHFHLIRQFGMQRSRVYEMQSVNEPNNSNLKQAQLTTWKFPQEVFKWYKSAEVHTHKRTIPKKLIALPFLILSLVVMVWYAYHVLSGIKDNGKPKGLLPQSEGQIMPSGQGSQPLTQKQYLEQYKPRIDGLPHTAPVYDEVTKPARAPVPVACVYNSKKCQCYSQQGTRLATPDLLCRQIVENGYFVNFDEKPIQTALNAPRSAPDSKDIPNPLNNP